MTDLTKLREALDKMIAGYSYDAFERNGNNYPPARAAVEALFAQLTRERDEWRDAVIDAVVVTHIYTAAHDTDPRKAINDAICWHVQVALDPCVSDDAQKLIQRGRDEALAQARRVPDGWKLVPMLPPAEIWRAWQHGGPSHAVGASYADFCAAYTAMLAAAPQPPSPWQPIETAPRDRPIIVWAAPYEGLKGFVTVCEWHPDAGFCVDELRFPTHWMPIPQPPLGGTNEVSFPPAQEGK